MMWCRLAVVVVVVLVLLTACGESDSGGDVVDLPTTVAPVGASPVGVTASPEVATQPAQVTQASAPPTWTPVPTRTLPPTVAFVTSTPPVSTAPPLPTNTGQDGTSPGLSTDLAPITAANAPQLTLITEGAYSANSVTWAADGRLAAAASEGVWLFAGGDVTKAVRLMADRGDWAGHATDCTAFSPDGQRILAGNTEGELRVWDATRFAVLNIIDAHEQTIWDCAYSPDGARLATGSDDNTVKIWSAADFELLMTLPIREGRDPAFDIAWSPDGALIGVGNNSNSMVSVWDAVSGTELVRLRGYSTMAWAVAFSPDGAWFAAGYHDAVRVFAVETLAAAQEGEREEPVAELVVDAPVHSLAFSPDGSLLLAGVGNGTLYLWDTGTWDENSQFAAHESGLEALRFSPDGTQLVTSGWDDAIRLWGIPAGE